MQMEPMTLGSPPSSPASPQTNPNYLPAFLMGDRQVQTPTRTNISPSKNRSFSFKSPTSTERRIQNRTYGTQQNDSPFNMTIEKAGPPALGLFDTLEHNEFVNSTRLDHVVNSARPDVGTPKNFEPQSPILHERFNSTPQNYRNLPDSDKPIAHLQRNLNDSLNRAHSFRRNLDKNENLWITVLGFPPHAASLVLSHFAQFGTITEKKYPPEGNWVHLKYSTQHEVAKAMAFNGKLISNSIMIGVIQHQKPQHTVLDDKENSQHSIETFQITSPNRARSLTQPYVLPRNTEVVSPQNVPQKSSGLVTKAMEYVFGW